MCCGTAGDGQAGFNNQQRSCSREGVYPLSCRRQVLCVKLLATTVSHVNLFEDAAVGHIPQERVQGKSRDEERNSTVCESPYV